MSERLESLEFQCADVVQDAPAVSPPARRPGRRPPAPHVFGLLPRPTPRVDPVAAAAARKEAIRAERDAECARHEDLKGEHFGCLRVDGYAGPMVGSLNALFDVVCDPALGGCGRRAIAPGSALRSGAAEHCGCKRVRGGGRRT